MKESYLFLAEGFEEMEALSAVDILRRADIPVRTVSITSSLQVRGAHGVTVTADLLFDNTLFTDALWLILPGGLPGATNLAEFAPLTGLLRSQMQSPDGRIAAICASPAMVLGEHGMLEGESATSYPGTQHLMRGANVVDAPVVVSGKFVTGNGPSNAMAWALCIVAQTKGQQIAERIANDLLLYPTNDNTLDWTFG